MSVVRITLLPSSPPPPAHRRVRRFGRARAALRRVLARAPFATRAGWLPTGYLSAGRAFHTATRLADGTVLVAGGYAENARPLASAELYDPATSRWRSAGTLAAARGHHTAALLPDGSVLVVGGTTGAVTDAGSITAAAERYIPATGTWVQVEPMLIPRAFHSAAGLADGSVLVAGGYRAPHEQIAEAERYDPAGGVWSTAGQLRLARAGHTATRLANGHVLIMGGEYGGIRELLALTSGEVYDPATNTWSLGGGSVAYGITGHAATQLHDGRVLVLGGEDGDDDPTGLTPWTALDQAAWSLSLGGSWVLTPDMGNMRLLPAAATLPDGTALATGGMYGCDARGSGCTGLSAVDRYTPGTPGRSDERGLWAPAPPMLDARAAHTATPLLDGSILVAGGLNFAAGGALDSAEIFDLALPDLTGCVLPLAGLAGAGSALVWYLIRRRR